jgi:colanic acid/amylovoran biosynthesis glycosyltransferase
MRVGVILNMKSGMEHFIYRELFFLTGEGLSISLFPTRFNLGLYNAPKEWTLQLWRPLAVMLSQVYFLFTSPVQYLRLLREAIQFRAFADFALAWYFTRCMADVDVIYATFGDQKLFVGYFCKHILNKPLVVTIHAYELYANPNPRLFVLALAACDQIITVSEHNREVLEASYQIDPARVKIVRYSLDLEEYRPAQKFIILIVSFFTYRKGHEILLKAVKQLEHDDIEVWVVGDVEGRKGVVDVRAMTTQLGMDGQVAFFGALKDTALKAVYHACDVFCLPSRKDHIGAFEGFPNVLIEAMACGKPVITTRHAEIPRVIPEIIVEENDIDGLAQALEQVYQSEALRRRLGEHNRKIAEATFAPSNASQTATILHNLAQQGSSTLKNEASGKQTVCA